MCVQPTFVHVLRGPSWVQQPVPCRKCWQCRSNKVSDYVGRALCEASISDWTLAITLTYRTTYEGNSDYLAEFITTPRHFQNYIKVLRKRGHSIRYMVCAEKGNLHGRVHFHAILFGNGPRLDIPHQQITHVSEWPHGHVYADWNADEKALRYVCKYILKTEGGEGHWFSLSKKPTIGADFFRRKAEREIENGVWPSKMEYAPPGGQPGRSYLLSGATRRDYLLALMDGHAKRSTFVRERLSEWTGRAYDKAHLERWLQQLPQEDTDAFCERIAEEFASRRLAPPDRGRRAPLATTPHVMLNGRATPYPLTDAVGRKIEVPYGSQDKKPSPRTAGRASWNLARARAAAEKAGKRLPRKGDD